MQNALLAYTISTLRILANIFHNKWGVFFGVATRTVRLGELLI